MESSSSVSTSAGLSKQHLGLVVAGHVDSGKSTTTGRLISELGGISARDLEKLREQARLLKDESFMYAYFTDTSKAERERGVTIDCTTKEFFTSNYHYTIVDAPGHRDYVKNMITGSNAADVALLMVPCDGNFNTAVARGDHGSGTVPGQTREHARLLFLSGIKQLVVGINKMDCDLAGYNEARYLEVKNEMMYMLKSVGWPAKFVENSVAYVPISGWKGDNLVKKSENMPWWKGVDLPLKTGGSVHADTLYDVLDKFVQPPKRDLSGPVRVPISDVLTIKGVGEVVCGRIEQGTLRPGDEVQFVPSNTVSFPCVGKVFSIEMHRKSVEKGLAGDNVGVNIKGFDKSLPNAGRPHAGDVMILKSDTSFRAAKRFTAQVSMLDIPGDGVGVGYTPILVVRTAKCACKIVSINWRQGKETSGARVENPTGPAAKLKTNDLAEVVFEPTKPFAVDSCDRSDTLSRVAGMEGNGACFLGKITSVEFI